jgi:hypothetical protein
MTPPRTPWRDFPDVFIHAAETVVKQHAQYRAAKSGDWHAAAGLVGATRSDAQTQALVRYVKDQGFDHATLVSAHAYEREGVNAIPEAFADLLGFACSWPVEDAVLQVNVVSHTGADG